MIKTYTGFHGNASLERKKKGGGGLSMGGNTGAEASRMSKV